MDDKFGSNEMTTKNRTNTKTKKIPENLDKIAEDWIQVTEARYDSMENLLQSVRRDIDVLSKRINVVSSPDPSIQNNLKTPTAHENQEISSNPHKRKEESNDPEKQYIQPDLLAHIGSIEEPLDDLVEPDEYMDISIRSEHNQLNRDYQQEKLLHENIGKSWRSPADVNKYGSFEADRSFSYDTMGHEHQATMETDLDDLQPEEDGDSDGSISPAVSPTFDNLTFDNVKLRNIMITSEDTITIPFNRSNSTEQATNKNEDYQVYDNDHSLTTIDEASEENEDESSSSEIDSLRDNINNTIINGNNNSEREHVTNGQSKPINLLSSDQNNRSINVGLKFSAKDYDSVEVEDFITRRNDFNEAAGKTLVIQEPDINISDSSLNLSEVLLRSKRIEGINKQRPISADSQGVIIKTLGLSGSGSLHSMISTISQESVISEADSYMTVYSRLVSTGSEEAYTTALSDSDVNGEITQKTILSQENDECNTLSRKRVKSHKLRNQDQVSPDLDTDTDEDLCANTPVPITVTPKFTRLPSRLMASPNNAMELNTSEGVECLIPSPSTHTQTNVTDLTEICENQSTESTTKTQKQKIPNTPYKRYILKRPCRNTSPNSPGDPHLTNTPKNSDSEEEHNGSSPSSTSSDSTSDDDDKNLIEGGDYDTSQPLTWMHANGEQLSGLISANMLNNSLIPMDLTETRRKRLSSIQETSSSSLSDRGSSDFDEQPDHQIKLPKVSRPRADPINQQQPIVVVPKFFTHTPNIIQPRIKIPEQPIDSSDGALTNLDQSVSNMKDILFTPDYLSAKCDLNEPMKTKIQSCSIDTVTATTIPKTTDSDKVKSVEQTEEKSLINTCDHTMPGSKSQIFHRPHYYPRRVNLSPGHPPLHPKPIVDFMKQNGNSPILPTSAVQQSDRLRRSDFGPNRLNMGTPFDGHQQIYDNESDQCSKSFTDQKQIGWKINHVAEVTSNKPHCIIEDQTRPVFSNESLKSNYQQKPDVPPYSSIYENSYGNKTQTPKFINGQYSDDIRIASQRTSRIIHGTFDEVKDNVRFIPTSVQSRHEITPMAVVENLNRQSFEREHEENQRTDSRRDNTHTDRLKNLENLPPVSHHIQVLKAPLSKSPPNVESSASDVKSSPSTIKPRRSSPSPQRCEFRQLSHSLASKPPSQLLTQTKWQLKSIPTDAEIRERMRSRSRQRTEERQSRPLHHNDQTGTYRPRTSRSDSRYRCTDLDSAIAESRIDPQETIYPIFIKNEPHTETKQSTRPSVYDTHVQTIPSNQRQLNLTSNIDFKKSLGDAKSYTSLLETDIDTGENFERPIIFETDLDKLDTKINDGTFDAILADKYENKTRSLFNLTVMHTPGTFRRQVSTELRNDSVGNVDVPVPSSENQYDKWCRAKSFQGLVNEKEESAAFKHSKRNLTNSINIQNENRNSGNGARGLIDRLKERARSTHELRIAQSLTKLHIPDWLDKSQCLQIPTTANLTTSKYEQTINGTLSKRSNQAQVQNQTIPSAHTHAATLTSLRFLSSTPKSHEMSTSVNSRLVETTAQPQWPKSASFHQLQFVRPSQLIRQRTEATTKIKPIQSKLYSSLRSVSAQRYKDGELQVKDMQPRTTQQMSKMGGDEIVLELKPQDFIPKYEQRRGRADRINSSLRSTRTIGEPILKDILKPRMESIPQKYISTKNKAQLEKSISDIKDVDEDSTTGGSNTTVDNAARSNQPNIILDKDKIVDKGITNPADYVNGMAMPNNYPSVYDETVDDNLVASRQEKVNSMTEDNSEAQWRSVDTEGETETEVTDGLDQITDLTCLTSLIDTCASRHRVLLANRPSALEHLLTCIGWWPAVLELHHHYLPPTAAEAISIAAHEFDVKEDSHRLEFLDFITGPDSHRPINLSEFGLNQLSGLIQRNPINGLLHISCGGPSCTKSAVPVSQAVNQDWCACANCYTLYCSQACRSSSERSLQDHPSDCSFARAKRACTRVLRNLSPKQLTGLTALAKTGVTRLGRGGILLSFALIRHAEVFLQQSLTQSFLNETASETILEHARRGWEKFHQPSPGGLLAPPIYLTINELEQLDSTVAAPCHAYVPSTSMVLIIVICAYELIARPDGRPVHLFKQSLILPFQSHQDTQNDSPEEVIVKKPQPLNSVTKRVVTQTNGLLNRTVPATTTSSREAYMMRLQRILRERGVSLRHHYPAIYTQIANFVETGVPFTSIRLSFHDFILQEEVICTIHPMADPIIKSVRESTSGTTHQELADQSTAKNNKSIEAPHRNSNKTSNSIRLNQSSAKNNRSSQQSQQRHLTETQF